MHTLGTGGAYSINQSKIIEMIIKLKDQRSRSGRNCLILCLDHSIFFLENALPGKNKKYFFQQSILPKSQKVKK